jgi:hypothetical protein
MQKTPATCERKQERSGKLAQTSLEAMAGILRR